MLKSAPITLGRHGQRQEVQTFEASLGHIARLCLKIKPNKKERKEGRNRREGGGREEERKGKGEREGKKGRKWKGRERRREGKRERDGMKVWRTLKFIYPSHPCSHLESQPEWEAVPPRKQPGIPCCLPSEAQCGILAVCEMILE